MGNWTHRVLSLLVVIAYLTLGAIRGGGRTFWIVFAGSLLPLACIWFADEFGRFTGFWPPYYIIRRQSPGCLLRLVAWVLLLLPALFAVLSRILRPG